MRGEEAPTSSEPLRSKRSLEAFCAGRQWSYSTRMGQSQLSAERSSLHAAAGGRSAPPCERTDRPSAQASSRTEDCVLFGDLFFLFLGGELGPTDHVSLFALSRSRALRGWSRARVAKGGRRPPLFMIKSLAIFVGGVSTLQTDCSGTRLRSARLPPPCARQLLRQRRCRSVHV